LFITLVFKKNTIFSENEWSSPKIIAFSKKKLWAKVAIILVIVNDAPCFVFELLSRAMLSFDNLSSVNADALSRDHCFTRSRARIELFRFVRPPVSGSNSGSGMTPKVDFFQGYFPRKFFMVNPAVKFRCKNRPLVTILMSSERTFFKKSNHSTTGWD
jgi:hypothetical protein